MINNFSTLIHKYNNNIFCVELNHVNKKITKNSTKMVSKNLFSISKVSKYLKFVNEFLKIKKERASCSCMQHNLFIVVLKYCLYV